MNNQQTALIQDSFALIMPIADQVVDLFYVRLFELYPILRPLFQSDLEAQRRKLLDTLTFMVDHLLVPDELIPAVQALGQRHYGYGVEARHYEAIGSTLIWALQQGLGTAFTPPVKAAWLELYTKLANIMLQGVELNSLSDPETRGGAYPEMPPPLRDDHSFAQPPPAVQPLDE